MNRTYLLNGKPIPHRQALPDTQWRTTPRNLTAWQRERIEPSFAPDHRRVNRLFVASWLLILLSSFVFWFAVGAQLFS